MGIVSLDKRTKHSEYSRFSRKSAFVCALWHFNSKATILYQATYENENFDKIGYLKENDNIWFNIGVSTFYNYAPIIEFVMGRLEE